MSISFHLSLPRPTPSSLPTHQHTLTLFGPLAIAAVRSNAISTAVLPQETPWFFSPLERAMACSSFNTVRRPKMTGMVVCSWICVYRDKK